MELTIPERVALLNVLPPQGSALTLRILQDLREQLSFTEGELEKYGMKQERAGDGGVFITWDEDFAKASKDIKIGKAVRGLIVDELKKLDRQQKLHVTQLPLYERFVDGEETKEVKEDEQKKT